MYSLLRKALFQLDPEDAHNAALKGLSLLKRCGLSCLASSSIKIKTTPVQVAGLTFSNRVGLAAGMDKNGDYIDEFGSLGFGFIEVGTITPRPQPGNPRPRMFRLPAAEAVINRMGFNNKGVEHLVANLKKRRFQGIVGVNIGKNFDTPLESAYKDYVFCLEAVYDYCDYITVNISSPNTKGLRDLQGDKHLSGLLEAISGARTAMTERGKVIRPVFLKIAPDLTNEDIAGVVSLVETHKIDGIIATNTTISRTAVSHLPHGDEAGGLSGAPLRERACEVVTTVCQASGGRLPVIGVGGIMKGDDASALISAGASLVQVYTGLVYQGPDLVPALINSTSNQD